MQTSSWSRVFAGAAYLLTLVGTAPGLAAAQPDEYRVTIQAAVVEFEAERWAEAQALFERANTIYPSGRALWGAGMAAFERRDYTTALRYLRDATRSDERPLSEDQRQSADALIERCMVFVARYAFDLSPVDATVTLDSLPATIIDGELIANPGLHELVVAAEGHDPVTRRLNAQPGFYGPLVVSLTPQSASEPRASTGPRLRIVGGTTVGVGAGIGLAAFLTGSFARRIHSELRIDCGGPCPADRQGDIDRGRRLTRASAALTAAGVAALGVGVSLLIASSLEDEDDVAVNGHRARLTPVLGRRVMGADLSVQF